MEYAKKAVDNGRQGMRIILEFKMVMRGCGDLIQHCYWYQRERWSGACSRETDHVKVA